MKNKFSAPSTKKKTVTKNIDDFIEKGGSVSQKAAKTEQKKKSEIQVVNVRIPLEDLEIIDALVKATKPKTDRHKWLLTAIYEKIQKQK